jgi:hypothetical protein
MNLDRQCHIKNYLLSMTLLAAASLGACASTADNLADGSSLRTIVVAQTDDPFASGRHGTATPQGTDPEVAASAVKTLRERGAAGGATSRPGLFDVLLGGMSGK